MPQEHEIRNNLWDVGELVAMARGLLRKGGRSESIHCWNWFCRKKQKNKKSSWQKKNTDNAV